MDFGPVHGTQGSQARKISDRLRKSHASVVRITISVLNLDSKSCELRHRKK